HSLEESELVNTPVLFPAKAKPVPSRSTELITGPGPPRSLTPVRAKSTPVTGRAIPGSAQMPGGSTQSLTLIFQSPVGFNSSQPASFSFITRISPVTLFSNVTVQTCEDHQVGGRAAPAVALQLVTIAAV